MGITREDIWKGEAEIALLYNYTVMVALPQRDRPDIQNRPFAEGETLVIGGTYLERSGSLVTIDHEVAEEKLPFWYGFQFRADNGVWYKPSGHNMLDESKSHNQLIAVVI